MSLNQFSSKVDDILVNVLNIVTGYPPKLTILTTLTLSPNKKFLKMTTRSPGGTLRPTTYRSKFSPTIFSSRPASLPLGYAYVKHITGLTMTSFLTAF